MSTASRVCALWLIALILTPFSAPFSVCDVATFFHVVQAPASNPFRPARPDRSVSDDSTNHGLPATRAVKSIRVADARARVWSLFPIEARETTARAAIFLAILNAPLISPLRI